ADEDVAAIVNASPQARPTHLLGPCRDEGCAARKKVRQDRRNRARAAAMCRPIARMIWRREQRLYVGIELEWPNGPRGELWIPTGDHRVMLRHAHRRIDLCRMRRIAIQLVLQRPLRRKRVPLAEIAVPRLGEESLGVSIECTREILDLSQLRNLLRRVV